MSAYIQGNLALNERVQEQEKYREKRKTVYRKTHIPVQEKLLYLFTIVICVLVAGVIIWRYAQIYDVNTKIQQIEKNIKILQEENKMLRLEVNQLQDPKRLLDKGRELGLVPTGDENINEVNAQSGLSDTAHRVAMR